MLNKGSPPNTIDLSPLGAGGTLLCVTGMNRDGGVNLSRIGLDEGLVVQVS